jgi:4-hydroxy-tetrahydrodipicolinate reductase
MRIAIIGYGKMGHMIEEVAVKRGHEIALKINIENTEEFTKENCSKADVAIEFTGPSTAYDNVKKCIDFGLPVISGSTGWNTKLDSVKEYCQQKGGSFLHTSNFSVGVNIFFEVNKLLAKLMSSHPEYEVSLKEIHHTAKLDAPSGTAVTLAEQVLVNLPGKINWVNHEAGKKEELAIISQRIDPAPGTHFVKYTSEIDDIEIIGAVLAAEYISDKNGIFSMQEVLGL